MNQKRGGPPPIVGQKAPGANGGTLLRSEDVITQLRVLLQQAERGEVVGLVAFPAGRDGAVRGLAVGQLNAKAMIAELELIKATFAFGEAKRIGMLGKL